jgi:very-short-patch-repair endonuclease/ABC-type molybdenum transport system ATPase subunit/photorepair protein PhrA
MKEILYKYRERLINLSGRNRSLVSMTLPKKRAFDILKLSEVKEGIEQEILQWLLTRDEKKIQLLEDSYVVLNHRKDELKKRMLQDKNREIEKLREENLVRGIHEERLLKLEERLNIRLEQELAAINADGEKIIDFFTSLKSLQKEINDLHKETGRYELYIGYPFIEGKFKDGTVVRAPLALFPVKLIRNGDQWYAENITERAVLLNRVFLLAFSKHNEIKLPAIDTEHEDIEEGFIDKVIQDLKDKNIAINYEEGSPVKFIDYKKDTFPKYNFGELNVKPYIILGQFPISNSIYNDYLELEDMDFENELLEQLLKSNAEEASTSEEQEGQGKLSFSEKDLFLVSPLDYSQEKAVQRVNETKQLVIYGPPGTGKSQTIANIIGGALAKNKTVLMVSQKRAALDVIYNRLAELNEKTVLIHDANGDKKNFYSLVASALEEAETKEKRYMDEILKAAKEIDNKIELLESIGIILHSERSYGLTLQEMYAKTKAITGREDERYEEFNRFRRNNVFKKDTYQTLKAAIDKIGTKELESFRQYDELRSKNAFIEDVNPNMSFMDIDELVQKVEEIIVPVKNIISKGLEDKEVYDGLMSLYEKNSYSLSKEAAEAFAVELNKKHNGSLLDKLNTGRWWSIPYWLNYSKNKRQEEENKRQFYIKEQEYKDKVHKMYLSIKEAFEDISIVRKALNEKAYSLVMRELLKGEDLTQYFMDIISALNQIEEYRGDLITVSSLDKLQIKILEYASDKDSAVVKKRIDGLSEFVTLYNISEIEKEERVQKVIGFIDSFGTIVNAVKDNMSVKQKLSREYVLSQWDNKISSLKLESSKDFKEFKRQANKKSKLWPIREYLEQYSQMILKVFPCFLLSPETVSEVFPLNEKMFDVVIFDEASQMYVENAIPTIFRGKQVVIAGDDKQLRPSSTFTSRLNNEDDEMDMDNAAAMEEESLLDLAKVNYHSVHLNYHYRSEYDELINFSNYAFYNGSLQVSPNLRTRSEYGSPIERRMVDGRWINRSNQKEAEETVNIVAKLFKERKNRETMGIITFNINQKTLIEDLLEKKAQQDEEFKKVYLEEIDREENNEDLSLFVKNIENVQGDERDIIIFSIAYAKNENGRVSVNFGSLSQDGGENRLNVAVSRAKKKIYVVTSIEPEELNVESSTYNGPRLFKKYLQYAREVSGGNKEAAQAVLNTVADTGVAKKTEREHDSDFEAEVYEALVKKGYEVHKQVGVSGYKIDLAVYNPKTSSYILGIECDGATYHSSKSARERDIHRQRYLESRGWNIARIWSRNWWRNPHGEVESIEKVLKGLSEDFK